MAAEWRVAPAKMRLLSQLDQRSVIGHDSIRPRSSSSASSSERTDVLSPLSSPPLSMPSPSRQEQPTVLLPVPPLSRQPSDARRRSRSASTATSPESLLPSNRMLPSDCTLSFETPSSKLDRLIAHHHQTRRKWESPCPPFAEQPSTSTETGRQNMAPRRPVAEQSVDVSGVANAWHSPSSSQHAATTNALMSSDLARAEALAIPPTVLRPPRVFVSNASAGSDSNPSATSFPRRS